MRDTIGGDGDQATRAVTRDEDLSFREPELSVERNPFAHELGRDHRAAENDLEMVPTVTRGQ